MRNNDRVLIWHFETDKKYLLYGIFIHQKNTAESHLNQEDIIWHLFREQSEIHIMAILMS